MADSYGHRELGSPNWGPVDFGDTLARVALYYPLRFRLDALSALSRGHPVLVGAEEFRLAAQTGSLP